MKRYESAIHALRDVYGYEAFRGVQEKAIASVMSQRDVFVLMATGGGKSLCYIIPCLACGMQGVVVSPLVSLMQDQVVSLQERGVSACYLGSSQPDPMIWDKLHTFQLIYVTPEMAATERFRQRLRTLQLALVAVDEAHCESEWGHDFRPEFRRLAELRQFVSCPFIAVTATATPECRADIVHQLQLDGDVHCTSVDRDNLSFSALLKTKNCAESAALAIKSHLPSNGTTLVYVPTTDETEQIAEQLCQLGVVAAAYHAQRTPEERRSVHSDFLSDRLAVVVATLAFGMGIDKPDVRVVIHWGVPKSIEAYFQQAGRAGRDGDPARCVLHYQMADFAKLDKVFGVERETIDRFRNYCQMRGGCRRAVLLRHFGEDTTLKCGKCDTCGNPTVDGTADVRLFLSATIACGNRCGVTTIVSLLRGTVKHEWLKSCPEHGSGTHRTDWESVSSASHAAGLVERVGCKGRVGSYSAVALTEDGRLWMADATSTLSIADAPSLAEESPDNSERSGIYIALVDCRRRLANRLPPYMVCSNETLRQLANMKPTSKDALLRVPGFGKVKVEKYGDVFLKCIRVHAINHEPEVESLLPPTLLDGGVR